VSNVGAFAELFSSARLLAMGNSGVGIARPDCALAVNPAGLAWVTGISAFSSYESRAFTYDCGDISAALDSAALSFQVLNFGDVLETDADGNVLGLISHQAAAVVLGVGLLRRAIPSFGECGLGATAKLLTTRLSGDGGNGAGLNLGVGFLAVGDPGQFEISYLSGYSFGVALSDIPLTGIHWSGGESEWSYPKMTVGGTLEFLDQLTLAADSIIGIGVRLGVEWSPVPPLAFRGGLRYEGGIPMWSGGVGVLLGTASLDYAFVSNPYLAAQHRVTLGWHWATPRP